MFSRKGTITGRAAKPGEKVDNRALPATGTKRKGTVVASSKPTKKK